MDPGPNSKLLALSVATIVIVVAIGAFLLYEEDDEGTTFVPIESLFEDESGQRIVLTEEQYAFAPITASLMGNRGIHTSIEFEGTGELVNMHVDGDDLSYYSSQVAVTFWDEVDEIIVVDSYEHAIMMCSVALYRDIPILVKGPSTLSAMHILHVGKGDAIVLGDVGFRGMVNLDEEEVLEYSVIVADEAGREIDYITVVDPWDSNETIADVPHQSALAPVLNAFRGGLVAACRPTADSINETVKIALNITGEHGMDPTFICMFGDAYSLPFVYAYDRQLGHDCPTDNWYGDTDGNPWTQEVATGRVIGITLRDVSHYLDRVFRYEHYLATTSRPGTSNPALMYPDDWNNNGLTYCATAAEFAGQSDIAVNDMLRDASFNTQDDSPQGHTGYATTVISAELLCSDFALANYILMDADHGNPYRTANFWGTELKPMNPGIFFAVSCSLGRMDLRGYGEEDDRYPDEEWGFTKSVTYLMMDNGLNAYFGSMRTAWGTFSSDAHQQAAPGLCYFLVQDMIDNDNTVGEALMNGKNALIAHDDSDVNRCTTWEYNCFGDPAFNPYEPVNEG